MKQISISDNAHKQISKEIEEERQKKTAKKSFGTIVDDMCEKRYRQEKMFIGRTQADPTRLPEGEPAAQSAINEVTHWWDGSQIYGSDQETTLYTRHSER